MALPLAVLLLMFCLGAVVPAMGPGCGESDSAARVCAQSGTATPILAVVHALPPIQTLVLPGMPLSPEKISAEPMQHHADPSTPRAPPRLT